MSNILQQAWLSLPEDANEQTLAMFLMPHLLKKLGFNEFEYVPQYSTGKDGHKVDFAVRKNNAEDDKFLYNRKNPALIIELKSRDTDLASTSTKYKSAVNQLKKYLHPLATYTKSVEWGIITNGNRIQLFRRHGKIVYPFLSNIKINYDNIEEKISLIKDCINDTNKGLSVAIYNNKGGIGKTTTTINLAGILSLPPFNKKVLVVDFDPNQRDLTDVLNIDNDKKGFFYYLRDRDKNIRDLIYPYRIQAKSGKEFGFDLIPSDESFFEVSQNQLSSYLGGIGKLRQVLEPIKSEYDYILIDTPPNWQFFSQEAVIASDVIMMPAKHNNYASIKNAVIAVQDFFPELGKKRRQYYQEMADPTPLPIFFNGEKITDAQRNQAKIAISKIIKEYPQKNRENLTQYFFPKYTKIKKDTTIYELPYYSHIAQAAFKYKPAVFFSKVAHNYYGDLARTYFIG